MQKNKKTNKLILLWYSHPRIAILLFLVIINMIIILLFTGILAIVSQNNFFDELAYIFTYTMCSDGIYDFVNSQEDLLCFVIKIILTVIQMIIFSGALIGFSTDVLQSTIDKSVNNLGKINLNGHYVFLNWSSIGPQIIYDLSFLEGSKNVVILTDQCRDDVLNSIYNIFIENNRKMKNIRVFVKEGSPNSIKHLDDISISKAKYVGVLLSQDEAYEENVMPSCDLDALKSLLNIINLSTSANIVVETLTEESVQKIEKLIASINPKLKERVIVFSHNSVLGNILGKTVINSKYSSLYHYLLSYEGSEFYGIEPMDMDEALYLYNDCIPIINYDDDDEVDVDGNKAYEHLYIFSDTEDTLGVRKEKKIIERRIEMLEIDKAEEFTVFTFSNDNEYAIIEEEINRYNAETKSNIVIKPYNYSDDFDKIIEEINNVNGKKKVVLLSSKDGDEDTNIFVSALTLKLGGCLNEDVEILAEITNPSNHNSLKNIGVMSVIMSNRIISLFMVQLLTHPGSQKFYRDIISTNVADGTDSIDIDLVKAGKIIKFEGETMSFATRTELVQSFYFSSNKEKMCIGIMRDGQEIEVLCDNMDEAKEIVLSKNDDLIVVSY